MSKQNTNKVNQLQKLLPAGILAGKKWFASQGYSPSLVARYVSSGWLESPARGVFRRPRLHVPEKEAWEPIVISLQEYVDAPFSLGGKTALEVQGFGHYVSSDGPVEIHLYGNSNLPSWVNSLSPDRPFIRHNDILFNYEKTSSNLVSAGYQPGSPDLTTHDPIHFGFRHMEWGMDGLQILMSSPERAILEFLDQVPAKESFDHADKLFENLRILSPNRLNRLLSACRSVKVKRLFMWFADRHAFRWRKHLEDVDLGRGKRALNKGGVLDATYQITVPRSMVQNGY